MTDPIIAALDIETTGLLSMDHRIVEIYLGLWRGGRKIWKYDQRIDPQRSIALEAQRVHGILASDLIGKPTWDVVGIVVHQILSRADYYVAHNGDGFDLPFLDQEFKRIGLPGLPDKPSFDTMTSGVWATHDGKKPRLEELCFSCGVSYDKTLAHAAEYDVACMMECFQAGIDYGFYSLDIPALSDAQAA
jgi:DNA polymerase-3 subunit epsilon